MGREATRSIVRDGIAVGVATGAYGISFGAISVASGLDVWQSCALSLLVFTGASQGEFNRSTQHRAVGASVVARRRPRPGFAT